MNDKQPQKQNNAAKTAVQELGEHIGELPAAPAPRAAVQPLEELPWADTPPPENNGLQKQSADLRRFMTAMARAQGEVKNAQKSKKNTHFNTTYADLAAIADACREALSKNLIAWVQTPCWSEGRVWLETTLTHGPSGQYKTGDYPIPAAAVGKSQDLVAAFTYARRASLAMMVGVVSEDEDVDGNDVPTGDPDGMNQDQQRQPVETKAQRMGKQWAAGAIRKIAILKTAEELSAWEQDAQRQETLADLARIVPDSHADVMAALKSRAAELDTATSG